MERRLEGKVVALTGGASGIGLGIIDRFYREGAKLVSLDLKPPVEREREKCLFLQGDVTVEADLERLVAAAVKEYGRLDVMVNCAGGAKSAPVADIPMESFEFTVKLCLFSVVYGIKYAARQMKLQGGGGSIINISSHSGTIPEEWMGPYCAAKAAVNQYTAVAALELGPFGIRVNAVAPGLTQTPIIDAYTGDSDCVEEIRMKTPLRKLGTVEDIAAYTLFLASQDSTHMTGTVQIIDGGQFLEGYPDVMDIVMGKLGCAFPYDETVKRGRGESAAGRREEMAAACKAPLSR